MGSHGRPEPSLAPTSWIGAIVLTHCIAQNVVQWSHARSNLIWRQIIRHVHVGRAAHVTLKRRLARAPL